MSVFRCGVCAKTFPVMQRHTHHKTPRAVGGADTPDNLIDLCNGCHGAVHSVAYKLAGKEPIQKTLDSVFLLYPDRMVARACWELAQKVHQEVLALRERGADPDTLVEVSTVVRSRHKAIIKRHCRDLGMSLDEYLRSLLIRDLLGKHGVSKDTEDSVVRSLRKRKKTL